MSIQQMLVTPSVFTINMTVGTVTDTLAIDNVRIFNGYFDTTHCVASAGRGSISNNNYNGYTIHDIVTEDVPFFVAGEGGGPDTWQPLWDSFIVIYDNGLPSPSFLMNTIKIGTVTNPVAQFLPLGGGYWKAAFGNGTETSFAELGWSVPDGSIQVIEIT